MDRLACFVGHNKLHLEKKNKTNHNIYLNQCAVDQLSMEILLLSKEAYPMHNSLEKQWFYT